MEEVMAWSAPKILEISCGMEINRYAPADGTDPIQF
jgi:coenzyme PQQ precursor peptide PqqA